MVPARSPTFQVFELSQGRIDDPTGRGDDLLELPQHLPLAGNPLLVAEPVAKRRNRHAPLLGPRPRLRTRISSIAFSRTVVRHGVRSGMLRRGKLTAREPGGNWGLYVFRRSQSAVGDRRAQLSKKAALKKEARRELRGHRISGKPGGGFHAASVFLRDAAAGRRQIAASAPPQGKAQTARPMVTLS